MSYTVPVAHSRLLHSFLTQRYWAGDADTALAHDLLHAQRPVDDDAPDYYDLVETPDGARISYTIPAKYQRLGVNPWIEGGHRIKVKPAKIAQKLTGIKDGRALDVFSNAACAYLSELPEVVLVSGEDIPYRYDEYNHCGCVDLGELEDSCMRYDYCQDRFGMYEDVAHLAVVLCPECGDTQARAIVWTDTTGKRWHDRIYGSPFTMSLMRRWFDAQDIGNVYGANVGPVTIQLPHTRYERAPYMDTMKHYCATCGTLSNRRSCRGVNHDYRYLSGYSYEGDGQDHEGWPGRACDECGCEVDDYGNCQECETCGARFSCDDSCPNERYCREHDRYYCAGYWGSNECPNAVECEGCDEAYCGETCPNDCFECPICGVWGVDGTCVEGCVECARCGIGSTREARGENETCPHCARS